MAEMRAERKSVLEYLSNNNFIIPMYQRPYTWGEDECEQLWEDILNFFEESRTNKDDEYFLGTAVVYNDKGYQTLIDGQQRTTTLTLFIRALYQKAYMQKNPQTQGLVSLLESCLWNSDDISGRVDYSLEHLRSEVAIDLDNTLLKQILSDEFLSCSSDELEERFEKTKSKYMQNFLFFIKKSDELAYEYPGDWENFCITLLKKCVILPIECNGEENALRIFNTLNNRGIPLADSDIFKGIIFGNQPDQESKELFAREWRELEKSLKDSSIDMNFIFTNHMHITRARKDKKDNVVGLGTFYTKKHKEVLSSPQTFTEIKELVSYWCGEEDSLLSLRALQYYDILELLPNEYWKYLDSAYYFYNKHKGENFFCDGELEKFLAQLIANFLVKLIEKPTIATIKLLTFNAYTSLYQSGELNYNTNTRQILENKELFKAQFLKANSLLKSLLCLNLYLKFEKQQVLTGEIEHIFPKTTNWRASYTGWDKEDAKEFIETIGNKMWLEKKLNIKASNGYFDDKKAKYKASNFLEAQALANLPQDDWLKDDIIRRNEEIFERLYQFFQENI